jgi:cell wall-associated NlpC family hydrolase
LQHSLPAKKSRRAWPLTLVGLVLLGMLGLHSIKGHALADIPELTSAADGYCLDNLHNDPAAAMQLWKCNASAAQNWTLTTDRIMHDGKCLGVGGSGNGGRAVRLMGCGDRAEQLWLRGKSGLFNPDSGLCLQAAAAQNGARILAGPCKALGGKLASWQAATSDGNAIPAPACNGAKGAKIACEAEKEWNIWQSGDHQALLQAYTGGTAYEAWCADFVSYVYREAGYPFRQAEGGWNENVAADIQHYNFTEHDPAEYQPKPGDVAFFSYDGGHVEIVVSGGAHPTFIYGNSGQTDPATGNGQMAANTITRDGDNGRLLYYLSPN